MTIPERLKKHALIAWVGEDELGSGIIGIKQCVVPAGFIPLAAMDYDQHKLEKLKGAMEGQAEYYGKKIRLVRFDFAVILGETTNGE